MYFDALSDVSFKYLTNYLAHTFLYRKHNWGFGSRQIIKMDIII